MTPGIVIAFILAFILGVACTLWVVKIAQDEQGKKPDDDWDCP